MASIQCWLANIRKHVLMRAPDIIPILDIYEGEARFGRRYIEADLARLSNGAAVLEVGAGSYLLSCQLVREGFRVIALEPLGEGFSHFERLRGLILEKAVELSCAPYALNQCAEDLSIKDHFDYAFSVNVMEHVSNVKEALIKIGASLKPSAIYRFTCPNYLFPYKPHFNIPTLFSKKITEKIFKRKIHTGNNLPDPIGTWKSLNWITVSTASNILKNLPTLNVSFNQLFLVASLERVGMDEEFALRRSVWMRIIILALLKFRMQRLAGYIPVAMQPIIDCTLTRRY